MFIVVPDTHLKSIKLHLDLRTDELEFVRDLLFHSTSSLAIYLSVRVHLLYGLCTCNFEFSIVKYTL